MLRSLVRLWPVWVLVSASAFAQTPPNPKFDYGKQEAVNGVQWKSSAKAGFTLATGNSQSSSLSAGATVSRKSQENGFSAEGGIAYAHSAILTALDDDPPGAPGNGFIDKDEIHAIDQTTTQSWFVTGRYDRYFAVSNSFYGSARVSADPPAGKEFIGGAQVGYSRQLFKTDRSDTAAEIGYDFAYEKYVAVDQAGAIHSVRAAVTHTHKMGTATLGHVGLEALFNLNSENVPNPDGPGPVGSFQDTRVNFDASLTTTLFDKVSFGFGFRAKFDNVPAPRPPFSLPYAPDFHPFADKLDTTTEASLIYTLL